MLQSDLGLKHPSIGPISKFLMKRRNCVEIPLTDALRLARPQLLKVPANRPIAQLAQFN
jgi:hypothetical protein